jgi:hypothetical protein
MNAAPSINLARMAWKLAQIRAFGSNLFLFRPVERNLVEPGPTGTPASLEYYQILRRLEDGEAP